MGEALPANKVKMILAEVWAHVEGKRTIIANFSVRGIFGCKIWKKGKTEVRKKTSSKEAAGKN